MTNSHSVAALMLSVLSVSACVESGPSAQAPTRGACPVEQIGQYRDAVEVLIARGFGGNSIQDFLALAGFYGCSEPQRREVLHLAQSVPAGGNGGLNQVRFDPATGRRFRYETPVEAARNWPQCFDDSNPRDCTLRYDPWGGLYRDDAYPGAEQSCRLTPDWRRHCAGEFIGGCWGGEAAPMVMAPGAPSSGARISLLGAVRQSTPAAPRPVPQPAAAANRNNVPLCITYAEFTGN